MIFGCDKFFRCLTQTLEAAIDKALISCWRSFDFKNEKEPRSNSLDEISQQKRAKCEGMKVHSLNSFCLDTAVKSFSGK